MKESESEVLKIEESESEFLCTDSTALVETNTAFIIKTTGYWCRLAETIISASRCALENIQFVICNP
jgi:hypothetical protein